MWIRAFLCLLLSMDGQSAWALDNEILNEEARVEQALFQLEPSLVESSYAYWYSDKTNLLEDIIALDHSDWTQVDSLGSYGFKKGEYWIHLTLSQSSPVVDSHIVRFIHPVHDVVDVHVLSKTGEKLNKYNLGDSLSNIQRPVQDKKPSFRVSFDKHSSVDIYIRVSGMNAMWLTMEVMTEADHQLSVQAEALTTGVMYGILMVMMLYNFGLAISIRDKAYFTYVGYVASYIILILCLTGDGFYYIWANSPNFNRWLLPVIAGFLMIPSALFPLYLLNIKKHAPKLLPIFYIIVGVVVLYLFSIPFRGANESLKLVNVISFTGSTVMLIIGIYLSIKKVPVALIYTASWFILLTGLVILPLSSAGIIEANIFTRYSNMLGGVVEVILLSLALAHRIGLERKEKIKAIKQSLKLKEEAAESRTMYQQLFDYAPIGMFRFSTTGELVAVNYFLTELIGYDHPNQILKMGKNIRGMFDNGYEAAVRALKFESVVEQESVLTTLNGNTRICSVTLRMNRQQETDVIEGFITDITQRKQAEKAHEIMEVERMTTMEQLVTGVAHEINAPLGNNVTSVSHLSELLAEVDDKMSDGSLTKRFFKDFVNDSQELMIVMSNNLTQISSLIQRFKLVSVNQMEIKKFEFNFFEQVEDFKDFYFFVHDENNGSSSVEVNVNCYGDEIINSYPAAWEIILDQLFENSITHGFHSDQLDKKIDIELKHEDDKWTMSYEDNGRGASAQIMPSIFDPFVTSKRGSLKNAGLGLYRVYNIVAQVLKGKVRAEAISGFKIVIEFR
jgi:PAS domain S-box-containing protein